jgi:hypothetical protein
MMVTMSETAGQEVMKAWDMSDTEVHLLIAKFLQTARIHLSQEQLGARVCAGGLVGRPGDMGHVRTLMEELAFLRSNFGTARVYQVFRTLYPEGGSSGSSGSSGSGGSGSVPSSSRLDTLMDDARVSPAT